jgi:riboflavin kinase/FMN adenylyltransferase
MSDTRGKTIIIGNFDGVHLGHQKLIDLGKRISQDTRTQLALITFRPHPKTIILDKNIDLLLPYEAKIGLLGQIGIKEIDEIEFTLEISKLDPEIFIDQFVIKRHSPTNIVVGTNFKFGFKASGNTETLKRRGLSQYTVHLVDMVESAGQKISSTSIKNLLSNGDIEKANRFLGRYYFVSGEIIEGERRGRQIGFPTANLGTTWNFLPRNGVYVTYVTHKGKRFEAITNIGFRPTFGKSDLLIESHILDFNDSIYGDKIKVEFVKRIRSEKKFDTVDELIENIKKDVRYARDTFLEESRND